ncbi:MAG: response regulator [Proteobacteria bacterium]|nr:response regulator [Pseudomonadota bacterium]
MDSLLETVTALASARTLDEVTRIVRSSARELTKADGVTFVLREDDKCFYADEEAIGPLWKGSRFPLQSCISGWAMLNRQIAVVADIYADARIPHEAYRPTFVKSLVMVPVRRDDPIAAIGAYWAQPHEATPAEQKVLQALANAAALALSNIELYGDLQRSLERERTARERAETANKLKDDFLATLSHELRTPLHVIQSWIWQLNRTEPPPALKKALEVIERNVALQSRLVEDLLDVSRASAGRLQLNTRLVDLASACLAVVEVLRLSARAKNIQLDVQQETSAFIWGDPDRVQQILWNVLNNAIKFTPNDGRILVRISRGDRRACVVIEDSGIGIAPQFLPFIFDRFRQADPSSTRRFGGMGLGLTIVKELVHLHGGTVEAASAGQDRGTTITLEFPVPAVLDQPGTWLRRRAGIAPPEARLDGVSILVVDDEPEVLSTLEGILRHHGAEVLTAASADEALKLLDQHQPAVLVSDLAMPGRTGFDLVRAVRALPTPAGKIPAAVLSAYLASEHAAEAESAGFQVFIEKPVQPLELVGQIAQLAGRAAIQ